MWKFWKTRDENAAEKPKPVESDMLIARERALKATIRANEILSKANSFSLNKELEEIERNLQKSPRLAFQLGFAIICLAIVMILLSSIFRYAH
jgi:hypothetical protein